MSLGFCILAFLAIVFLMAFSFMISFCTHVGEKGYKNDLIEFILGIILGALTVPLGMICYSKFESTGKIYAIFIIALGLVFILCSIIIIQGLLKEKAGNLVTETLVNVRVIPAGYHNRSRQLEGYVNGSYSSFMFRGVDKALVKNINSNSTVTVVYHSSNRRVESITINN